jgi:predicted alpha/beta-fold hydrolase
MTRFRAPRWLRGGHAQTVFGALARWPARLFTTRERWELPDGDFVDVDRLAPPAADAPLAVVCHGLEGSARSPYVGALLGELRARGAGGLALNFRGCSGELNRLARFYHSGETEDLALVIARLVAERPGRKLVLAGFSLGGNVVAKYLGERGDAVPAEVVAAAVVSVPFDLARCAAALDAPGVMARIYRERFLRQLRKKVLAKQAAHGAVDLAAARRARTLRAFDDAVTAPLHGFAGAEDYWARSSSGPLLAGVRRPLLILAAEDDPFIPADVLPVAAARENPQLTLEVSPGGGHVAFVSGPPWAPRRHAERRVAEFLAARW